MQGDTMSCDCHVACICIYTELTGSALEMFKQICEKRPASMVHIYSYVQWNL